LLPLFIGIFIYAAWRGIPFIDFNHSFFPLFKNKTNSIILYNLPDFLWFYAFLSAFKLIWKDENGGLYFFWLFISIIVCLASELLQKKGLINGTFDMKDILAYFMAILFFIFNFKILPKIKTYNPKL
jgi:hypothetical protein